MYAVTLVSNLGETFVYSSDTDSVDHHAWYAIGNKIVIYRKEYVLVYDIIAHRNPLSGRSSNNSSFSDVCRSVEIVEQNVAPLSSTTTLTRTNTGSWLLDVLFVDVFPPSTPDDIISLYDNAPLLERKSAAAPLYLDCLFVASPLVDLSLLLHQKCILLSYGVAEDRQVGRLVMKLSQHAVEFVKTNADTCFLATVRFDVDCAKAGDVVLYPKGNALLHYCQLVCCKNTNSKIKHFSQPPERHDEKKSKNIDRCKNRCKTKTAQSAVGK